MTPAHDNCPCPKQDRESLTWQARLLKHQGLSYSAVGAALGVNRWYVHSLLRIKSSNDGLCEECSRPGTKENPLHHHHLNYLTDEHRLLCYWCHKKEHAAEQLQAMSKKLDRFKAQPSTIRAMSAATGLGRHSLIIWCGKLGIKIVHGKRKITPEMRAEILQLAPNMTQQKIADKFKISHDAVRLVIKRDQEAKQ